MLKYRYDQVVPGWYCSCNYNRNIPGDKEEQTL